MISSVIYFVNVFIITISTIFLLSIDGLYIKRTIVNMPISLVTNAVCKFNESEQASPYFDIEILYDNLDNYLSKTLDNKCKSYSFSILPYIIDNQNGYKEYYFDEDEINKNVKIDFECIYNLNTNFNCSFRYEINQYGEVING